MTLREANEARRQLEAQGWRCERQRYRTGPYGWAVLATDRAIGSTVKVTVPGQVMTLGSLPKARVAPLS